MKASRNFLHYINSGPYRILIVDDEAPHRALEREILALPKYEVVEVASGEEALAVLKTLAFDAVLLDKRMPGIDGDEVCRRIRSDLSELLLPVIMVTGSGSSEDLSASMRAGATDFIRKPYNPLELTARVDAAVERKRMTDQLDSAESMLFALARMVEAKDEYTGDHCSRLTHNAIIFGQALGLDQEELLALRRGGVLHDIGKLGIPDSILLKPGKLDDSEWVVMKSHTTIGSQLCGGLKSMTGTVSIIRSHHERCDGSGYPDGLKGEEIPLLARVFQFIDIYDALSNERPYKKAMGRDQIIRIFEEETARGWRDPELAGVFLDILRNRPEELERTTSAIEDIGAHIYDEIARTGALDWDRRRREAGGTAA